MTPSDLDSASCPLLVGLRPFPADRTWTGLVATLLREGTGLAFTIEHPAESTVAITTDVIGILTDGGRRRSRAPNPTQALSQAQHPGARLVGRRLRPQ